MIQPERIQILNSRKVEAGEYVLYWMQASQRADGNHALEYAIREANRLRLPVVACFGITDQFPEANERHYVFMLEGLKSTAMALERRGIDFVLQRRPPDEVAVELGRRAALVVTDRGYLRIERQWRKRAARNARCRMVQVESNAIVPVQTASARVEYTAATFRPKIRELEERFLVPLKMKDPDVPCRKRTADRLDLANIEWVLSRLSIPRSVPRSPSYRGGAAEAERRWKTFFAEHLDHFHTLRNDPAWDRQSGLSPYLHFGQISPLRLALEARRKGGPGADAFLEELIVRRELGINFVHYNRAYDTYEGLPEWARKTLADHRRDRRPVLYSRERLERADTHDRYWNAAQREMVDTGKMHGYMRMYWGKKILEWSRTPEEAFATALELNNRYEIDGRDPNGFAGVAWCFGQHDRPWGEREVFGMVRYMNDRGLERKFDMETYVNRIAGTEPTA
ncbi:MAG: deoxyribodipyrimidine photo-lyase [Kiritimatiellae bacterium]|nr:deoxyribodipyrimidine photo-lyase [Kiritimatiellia bacterium]